MNNSGLTWGGPFKNFPEKGWDNIFNVNVKSIFYSALIFFNSFYRFLFKEILVTAGSVTILPSGRIVH